LRKATLRNSLWVHPESTKAREAQIAANHNVNIINIAEAFGNLLNGPEIPSSTARIGANERGLKRFGIHLGQGNNYLHGTLLLWVTGLLKARKAKGIRSTLTLPRALILYATIIELSKSKAPFRNHKKVVFRLLKHHN